MLVKLEIFSKFAWCMLVKRRANWGDPSRRKWWPVFFQETHQMPLSLWDSGQKIGTFLTICTLHTEVTKTHTPSSNKKDSAVRIRIHVRCFFFCSPAPGFIQKLEYIPHASFTSDIKCNLGSLFWCLKPTCSKYAINRWLKAMICLVIKSNQQIALKQSKLYFYQTCRLQVHLQLTKCSLLDNNNKPLFDPQKTW